MNSDQKTYTPAVAIPAFRRPDAFKKLLQSVNDAVYPAGGCTLILSLEGGVKDEVRKVAEEFVFNHGEKRIVTQSEKMGLKSHIYSCADYSNEFGSIIVLEEDLIVSPAYYLFAVKALQEYQEMDQVAGISLYAQRFNETAQLPFEPMPSYYAGYFMQLACSWGQAWTAQQWNGYQEWIAKHPVPEPLEDIRIPENIRDWPSESWKKEFNYYLATTGRTIFYPYQSVTTNSSHHGGENMSDTGSLFDVPMVQMANGIDSLLFPPEEGAMISYDMYMESNGGYIENITGFKRDEIAMDLYGTKPGELLSERKHFITSKIVENAEARYQLLTKPIESNLKYAAPADSDSFFSLGSFYDGESVRENHSAYITIAHFLSYNRLDTKKFIIRNLSYTLRNKLSHR